MKKLIIIFIFLSTFAKAQEIKTPLNQNLIVGAEFIPANPVMSIHQYMPFISFNAGTDNFLVGCKISYDNESPQQAIIGFYSHTRIFKAEKLVSVFLVTGVGFNSKYVVENKFSERHLRHYAEVGIIARYDVNNKIFLEQTVKQQYYSSDGVIVFSAAVGYRLK